jgi:hypothetical protein
VLEEINTWSMVAEVTSVYRRIIKGRYKNIQNLKSCSEVTLVNKEFDHKGHQSGNYLISCKLQIISLHPEILDKAVLGTFF